MSEERGARWRAWMVAAQCGDNSCYEKLLLELLPYVRRFVERRLFDRSSAEDVVQNVFVSLHRARHTYRAERPFQPWLWAIAKNAVIDHLRARARGQAKEVSLDTADLPEPQAPPAGAQQPALSGELAEALEALPPAQREAVSLIHLYGLSVAEAAARVGVTRSALKVRAHRGYRALRARLERAET